MLNIKSSSKWKESWVVMLLMGRPSPTAPGWSLWALNQKKREGAVLSVGTDIRGVSSGSPAVFHIDGWCSTSAPWVWVGFGGGRIGWVGLGLVLGCGWIWDWAGLWLDQLGWIGLDLVCSWIGVGLDAWGHLLLSCHWLPGEEAKPWFMDTSWAQGWVRGSPEQKSPAQSQSPRMQKRVSECVVV